MKWVTARNLESWAEGQSGKSNFPDLIADLIRASSPNIASYRFPTGDKGQVRGLDGYLQIAPNSPLSPYFPIGESVWELGAGDDYLEKANDDYKKRTAEFDPARRSTHTFVFATPRTWDRPKISLEDWVNTRKAKAEWQDVRCIDGAVFERWLQDCPAVAARFANEQLNKNPGLGAISTSQFWEEFANSFDPALLEDVLLCDRTDQAEQLIARLLAGPIEAKFAADSPDEVIAFAIAAMRKTATVDQRLYLEARAIVIETKEAARELSSSPGLIYLPRHQATSLEGLLSTKGPTVVFSGRDTPYSSSVRLTRPSIGSVSKTLASMVGDYDRAYQLARGSGRSITILRRLIPRGSFVMPEWATTGQPLLPALLAGAWDSASLDDKAIVSALANNENYDEVEGQLRPFVQLFDPPLDCEQTIWAIRAPVDAFLHLARFLGAEHFRRLKDVATTVFSKIDDLPTAETPFERRDRDATKHSKWLRDGLATTLLQIAALHKQANVNCGKKTPQQYVDEVIGGLPGLSTNPQSIVSLRQQLPMLAEAAPDPLLSALEQMLGGDESKAGTFFLATNDMFSPTSPHVYLLWALEVLAWDPKYLTRAVALLARLSRLDPGGLSGNRPINTLREILLPWHPYTNASLTARIAALDHVISREPLIGWQLIELLLPKTHDSASPTVEPRFRDAGASEREQLTYGLIWQANEEIEKRAIKLAGEDSGRWAAVIGALHNFQEQSRAAAVIAIDALLSRINEDERFVIWSLLRDEVAKQRQFANAEWTLKEDDLRPMDEIVARFAPSDRVKQLRWLFDDWMPEIPSAPEDAYDNAEKLRREEVAKLYASDGSAAISRLAKEAKLPQFVATAAVEGIPQPSVWATLVRNGLADDAKPSHFLAVLSGHAARKDRQQWKSLLFPILIEQATDSETSADLLLMWPDDRETWDFVAEFNDKVARSYWARKGAWKVDGPIEDAIFAAEKYLESGRPTSAISVLRHVALKAPAELLIRALESCPREINHNPVRASGPFEHDLIKTLDELKKREDITATTIAGIEYAFLPMLRNKDYRLTIHKIMAEAPAFFLMVLQGAYKRLGEENIEPTPERKRHAEASYRLLNSFSSVPGASDDKIDEQVLKSWIIGLRELAPEESLKSVDYYIGHTLAHAQTDPEDSAWPHKIVRNMIEFVASDRLEHGLQLERFNMRGMFSREMFEGGKQERELARTYRTWAVATGSWPRTSNLLRRIAEGWDSDAERADSEARLAQMRR
jgi:hypothetical protein